MEIQLENKTNNIFRLLRDSENYIDFCPERGGIITNWICGGQKILYFDENRFLKKSLSIRGGVPILFPICGKIDSKFSLFGRKYLELQQHGFARDLIWKFQFNKKDNSLNLFLKNNEYTKQYFPFDFDIKITVILKHNSLNFESEISNNSNKPMPICFGLHPYFNISDFKNIEFLDYPLVCMDQNNNSLLLTDKCLSNLHEGIDLLMYSSGSLSFKDYVFNRKITLINPYPFDIGVIWSDPPRQMICMEPWTSPRNSLINGFRKIYIPSNSSKLLKASILINNIEKRVKK